MAERKGLVTLKGNPVTLVGKEVKVGDAAPDVTLVGNDLKAVALSTFRGKVVVLSSVPSLDTPVCDTETRRFNEEAAKLGDGVADLDFLADERHRIALECHEPLAFGHDFLLLRLFARCRAPLAGGDRQGARRNEYRDDSDSHGDRNPLAGHDVAGAGGLPVFPPMTSRGRAGCSIPARKPPWRRG